jgi:hypothetical protein
MDVAVGADSSGPHQNAAAWTSRDGMTWSRVPPTQFQGPGDQAMRRVIARGTGLIALGYRSTGSDLDAAAWESQDGRFWTLIRQGALGGPGDQDIRGAVANRSDVVAVGDDVAGVDEDAAVWTLAGDTWARVPPRKLHAAGNQEMAGVATGPTGLVAVGSTEAGGDTDAAVWRSADGRRWRLLRDQAEFGGPGEQRMYGVTWTPHGYVACGRDASGGAVWTSPNGLIWTKATLPVRLGTTFVDPRAVVVFDGNVFVLGGERVGEDEDAAVWIGRSSAPGRA